MNLVNKVKFNGDLKLSLEEVLKPLGGISSIVDPGDTVLVKPNFNTADPYPASSDVNFIRAVLNLIIEVDVEEVILGDSCTFSQKTRRVMNDLDVFSLEKENDKVKVISFDEGKWVKRQITGSKYLKSLSVPEVLGNVDKLILLPCLKTHFLAQYTGALKLSVGFMRPCERLKKHMYKLQEKIAELNLLINPDLIIMDGRKCFISGGPSDGELREPKIILASKSRVAIDEEGVNIIKKYDGNSLSNVEPSSLVQIRYAKELGIS